MADRIRLYNSLAVAKPGQLLRFKEGDHEFLAIALSNRAEDFNRYNFCVVCTTCEKLLHEATHLVEKFVDIHLQKEPTKT